MSFSNVMSRQTWLIAHFVLWSIQPYILASSHCIISRKNANKSLSIMLLEKSLCFSILCSFVNTMEADDETLHGQVNKEILHLKTHSF